MCLYRGFLFTMHLYRSLSFTKHLYRGFSFTMWLYKDFLFTMYLYKSFLLCASLHRLFVYCVFLQRPFVLFFFFRSVEFCLCYYLSRNYVFEPIGLLRFRHVLDSFTNCLIRTSIHARIFKILDMWLPHFLC